MVREARRGQRRGPPQGRRSRSCSAAAARRRWPWSAAGIPFEVIPGRLARRWPGRRWPASRSPTAGLASGFVVALGPRRRPPTARCWTALPPRRADPGGADGLRRPGRHRRPPAGPRASPPTPRRRWSPARPRPRPGAGWAARRSAGRRAGARPIAWPPARRCWWWWARWSRWPRAGPAARRRRRRRSCRKEGAAVTAAPDAGRMGDSAAAAPARGAPAACRWRG